MVSLPLGTATPASKILISSKQVVNMPEPGFFKQCRCLRRMLAVTADHQDEVVK